MALASKTVSDEALTAEASRSTAVRPAVAAAPASRCGAVPRVALGHEHPVGKSVIHIRQHRAVRALIRSVHHGICDRPEHVAPADHLAGSRLNPAADRRFLSTCRAPPHPDDGTRDRACGSRRDPVQPRCPPIGKGKGLPTDYRLALVVRPSPQFLMGEDPQQGSRQRVGHHHVRSDGEDTPVLPVQEPLKGLGDGSVPMQRSCIRVSGTRACLLYVR